jgi:hypothetical protein
MKHYYLRGSEMTPEHYLKIPVPEKQLEQEKQTAQLDSA